MKAKSIQGMTAKQFYEVCKEHGACPEGLRAIKGKRPQDWWDAADIHESIEAIGDRGTS